MVVDYVGKPDALAKTKEDISSFGEKTIAVVADVSKPDQVQNLIDIAVKTCGRVDIVVNNAGVEKKLAFVDYPLDGLTKDFKRESRWPFSGLPSGRSSDDQAGTGRSAHQHFFCSRRSSYADKRGLLRQQGRFADAHSDNRSGISERQITVNNIGARAVYTPIDANVEAKPEMEYTPVGELALVGKHSGVGRVYGHNFSGPLAWAMWRAIYLAKMPDAAQKGRILRDWVLDFIFGRDPISIGPGIPAAREEA